MATRVPSLFQALIPVIFMVAFLSIGIIVFDSSPHIPLILGTIVATFVGLKLGYRWTQIEKGIVNGIVIALPACLILMIIGILIGTWISSGIVPAMIYYGLQILSPSIFLTTACLICALVSLATGSSWSTAGTVGIALIGIGKGLEIPLQYVAGAIISGSYFGDKMSPLSDTTNLAPAVAGSELFTHIRHMVYTTLPALVIALIGYTIIGFYYIEQKAPQAGINSMLNILQAHFYISPLLLIPPVIIIMMVLFKIPALPSIVLGAILGGVFAILFQNVSIAQVLQAAQSGYTIETTSTAVNELVNRGGLESMLPTVALIIFALSFGGAMESTGMLTIIATAILGLAKNTGSLVLSTILTCVVMNVIAADQYLSIVIPGRMYRTAFRKKLLKPKNLSRCLEDGGTLSSSLVPWNSGGAYMWATLGVYPFMYLPFAFLNLITPVISVIYGYTGITMHKINKGDKP
jgi:NhaC family Na+:H+ antiporter